MTAVEKWGALIFISIVILVYLLAFFALVRILLKRFGYITKESTRRQKMVYHLVFSVALFGLMVMAYGYFIEPYRLTISRINIKSKKLPHNSRAIKVAPFSDLHCDSKKRVEDKLIVALNFEKPDLILFTGDTINGPEGLINAKDTFTELAHIALTYVVKGNWDVWYWYKLKFLCLCVLKREILLIIWFKLVALFAMVKLLLLYCLIFLWFKLNFATTLIPRERLQNKVGNYWSNSNEKDDENANNIYCVGRYAIGGSNWYIERRRPFGCAAMDRRKMGN